MATTNEWRDWEQPSTNRRRLPGDGHLRFVARDAALGAAIGATASGVGSGVVASGSAHGAALGVQATP